MVPRNSIQYVRGERSRTPIWLHEYIVYRRFPLEIVVDLKSRGRCKLKRENSDAFVPRIYVIRGGSRDTTCRWFILYSAGPAHTSYHAADRVVLVRSHRARTKNIKKLSTAKEKRSTYIRRHRASNSDQPKRVYRIVTAAVAWFYCVTRTLLRTTTSGPYKRPGVLVRGSLSWPPEGPPEGWLSLCTTKWLGRWSACLSISISWVESLTECMLAGTFSCLKK